MADYDLTTEEKDALRAGDPRKLRQLGVHGMLCLYIKRLQPEFRDNIYWHKSRVESIRRSAGRCVSRRFTSAQICAFSFDPLYTVC